MEREFCYAKRILVKKNQNPFISQTDLVYELLRDDILHRYREFGSKINQDQLANLLNVSRSPIRDAIHRLIDEGFLVKRGKRGYYVYVPTIKDVTYSSEFRIAIEIHAGFLAMQRVTAQDLELMRQNLEKQAVCCHEQDLRKLISLDLEFHNLLVSCSKNTYMIHTYQQYTARFQQLHNRIIVLDMWDIIFSQHKDILSAIEDKDKSRLETVMRRHLNNSEDFMHAPEYYYE